MDYIFDRLYGKLDFPKIIEELFDCPGLLRLRRIGLANINFINFPSFSAVTRYEHSIGVCHLAEIASNVLKLPEKDKIELMLAALYHDVATPPFAHAMEEVLKKYYGFDHEKRFYDLFTLNSNDIGGEYFQIFHGRILKLKKICRSAQGRKIGLDYYRIPELVFGKKEDPLSKFICDKIDLDNIDNVVRAASAMGIGWAKGELAESLAQSFPFYEDSSSHFFQIADENIKKWKNLRETLYEMIYCSVADFSLQTMLKHALQILIECKDDKLRLREEDWKLTEDGVFDKMKKHPLTNRIYKRMELKKLYTCITLLWISGPGILNFIETDDKKLEIEFLGKNIFHVDIVLNYYIDKRHRNMNTLFSSNAAKKSTKKNGIGLLVGIFTPDYIDTFDKNKKKKYINDESKKDFIVAFKKIVSDKFSMYKVKIEYFENYPTIRLIEEI